MLNVIRTVMLNVICDSNGIAIIKYFDGFCMSYSICGHIQHWGGSVVAEIAEEAFF